MQRGFFQALKGKGEAENPKIAGQTAGGRVVGFLGGCTNWCGRLFREGANPRTPRPPLQFVLQLFRGGLTLDRGVKGFKRVGQTLGPRLVFQFAGRTDSVSRASRWASNMR